MLTAISKLVLVSRVGILQRSSPDRFRMTTFTNRISAGETL